MSIHKLRVNYCRILSHVEIEPSTSLNLITGANGSGKSSLLEAISLLGTGRSFRSSSVVPVIQHQQSSLIVSAQIEAASGALISVGMERGRQMQRLQINRTPVQKLSEFAEQLPLQTITPESIDLVMGSPRRRRSFLDWGMFHVEPQFLSLSKTYKKVLKQRNALLKQKKVGTNELKYWDSQLVTLGERITKYRKQYLDELSETFKAIAIPEIPLFEELDVHFEYRQGWKDSLSLAEAIQQNRKRELMVGHTVVGPQEADLQIFSQKERAKQLLSRGQAKLLSMGLYLAQLAHLDTKRGKKGVVLIDDLFSELDRENSLTIFRYLAESGYQVFATTAEEVDEIIGEYPVKRFHVEHGKLIVN